MLKFVLIISYFTSLFPSAISRLDDNLSVLEFVRNYNYSIEEHLYETKDGYKLKIHRIFRGVTNQGTKNVALLVHGMGGSAENYILLGPPNALAFYFADRNYDVWLFNARGTIHSRKHKTLNPNRDRKKFWSFSWHEIAIYDLPATIHYIQKITGVEKLTYVGHSQGTTVLLVMLSEFPEMNEKLNSVTLLAPSAHLWHTHSPFLIVATRFLNLAQRLLSFFNWYELIIPNSPMINGVLQLVCGVESMKDLCMDIVYLIGGTESGFVNKTLLPVILRFSPSGFATQQLWHYGQVISTGEFKKYDFGKRKNLRLYNQTTPPFYNLNNCKVPMLLFYAVEDPFGNPKMIDELSEYLPNVALKYEVPVNGWNHLDFILAYNVKDVIYDVMFQVIQEIVGI